MEDILKQLFYGDYSAFDDISFISTAGEPDQHRRGEISMQLKALVPQEQFKLLEELLNSMHLAQTEDMERAFNAGVRLGAQFIIAACLMNSTGQETEAIE